MAPTVLSVWGRFEGGPEVTFVGINYLAVAVAAGAGFVFGALWYGLLGKQWMAALDLSEQPKQSPGPYVIAFAAQLVMAWVLAGVVGHFGEVTPMTALVTACLVWVGFVVTTQTVNHRFQSARWSLTVIDSGHWLGVLLVMGLVIGLVGV